VRRLRDWPAWALVAGAYILLGLGASAVAKALTHLLTHGL